MYNLFMLPLNDKNFIDAVIQAVLSASKKVAGMKQLGLSVPALAYSTTFHDTIIAELAKANKGFSKGAKSNDISYKGERWELKTNRGKSGCTINRINKFENVKLIIVNALPEQEKIFSIRLLEAKEEYFTSEDRGTQMKRLLPLGEKNAIQIYPKSTSQTGL
jgi:hypothetical protein